MSAYQKKIGEFNKPLKQLMGGRMDKAALADTVKRYALTVMPVNKTHLEVRPLTASELPALALTDTPGAAVDAAP